MGKVTHERHLPDKRGYAYPSDVIKGDVSVEAGKQEPDFLVPVTLDECEELAPDLAAKDGFDLACRFASR